MGFIVRETKIPDTDISRLEGEEKTMKRIYSCYTFHTFNSLPTSFKGTKPLPLTFSSSPSSPLPYLMNNLINI